MPRWIHARAKHLLAKNPSMGKSTAFAVATMQSHKVGKTPKGYGTAEGKREAKQKMDKPRKEYIKTPNPDSLKTSKLASVEFAAMSEEMQKMALNPALFGALAGGAGGALAAGKGNRLKGALGGAALGGAAGYGAGKFMARRAAKAIPRAAMHAEQSLPKVMVQPQARAATKVVPRVAKKPSVVINPKVRRGPSNVKTIAGGAAAPTRPVPSQTKQITSGLGARQTKMTVQPSSASLGEAATIQASPTLPSAGMSKAPAVGVRPRNLTPTQIGSQQAAEAYQSLPPQLQKALETNPLVQKGMSPEIAMQLAAMSRVPGEDALSAIGRHAVMPLGAPISSGVRRASHTAVTKAASVYLPMLFELVKMGAVDFSYVADVGKKLDKNLKDAGIDIDKQRSVGSIRKMLSYIRDKEKRAFTESQYSGGLGPGPMYYFNHGPRPSAQPTGQKTAGPPGQKSKKEKDSCGYKSAAAMADELMKLNAVTSPQSQLSKTQKIGVPKVTAPPGPSIQQISKPVGFGRPQPGATKSGAI